MNEESIIKKILQSEITWVLFIIASVMGFVSTVVLPLNKLQIQLTQIQADLADNKTSYKEAMMEHINLKSRVDILEEKIRNIK